MVESLQGFDRFFRIAFGQQHVALQPAAIDVVRIAAKDIFKERERLVVFLGFEGKFRQQGPARGIIRRLLCHVGGNASYLLGITDSGFERCVFQAFHGTNRREFRRFLEFFAGLFLIFLD